MRAWWVGLLVVLAAAWLLGVPPVQPVRHVAVVANAPAVDKPVDRDPGPPSAFGVLHARNLEAALSEFSLVSSAPELRRLRAEVDAACRVLVLLDLDGRNDVDARRDQARKELARRCIDLPVPSMYVPVVDTRLPSEDGPDPALGAAALADLRTARFPERLIEAWLEAFRQDALPQHQIFPDQRRLLPAEAETLIRVVIDWRECARLNACGPDGLFALRVCALHGCVTGSDVRSAWHQALSPRDYESAIAIHEWLLEWQAGTG